MKQISILDRILLLATGLLAAYQIIVGVEGASTLAQTSFTITFGVLLVAGLLLIILGFEALDSPVVVIVSTLIPLSLSIGLVTKYFAELTISYLIFAIAGLLAIIITRYKTPGKAAVMVLMVVHGISGLLIFSLPIVLALRGVTNGGFALVGVGGGLIGIGGMLLSFLKAGKPILSRDIILTVLPGLLLLMTAAFVAGFALG
ncbi:MAG: hypothetical protein ISR60_00645 [Anaerolineales bacterium]|nr:hypothetical protein [Anaerolineales bacterium]